VGKQVHCARSPEGTREIGPEQTTRKRGRKILPPSRTNPLKPKPRLEWATRLFSGNWGFIL
jgi:hypothetical protein